tara:strand:+ start:81 stop:917 length:837 start_codon:yes stop_codon:yes gene_type:complete
MFIWLASYPKSGNTFTRALLSSYYFSKDGTFDSNLLKNIKQFPSNALFRKYDFETKNDKEMIKNYIKVQKLINKKNSIQFLKTHSSLFNINNIHFTDLDCSLGVIYIVRDPRNVVSSFAHHFSISIKEASNRMINGHIIGTGLDENTIQFTGSWNLNFNSWKSFKLPKKYLLIKYEDLVDNTEEIFLKILTFINKLSTTDIIVDEKKFSNAVKSCDFELLKKKEAKEGFIESVIDKDSKKRINFFNLGKKNNYKSLDLNIRKELESSFQKEMKELGYL